MSSSNIKTLVALVNAMIGSAMLVLPLMSIKAGIFTTVVLVLISGTYNLYSCKIVMEHTNEQENTFGQAINRHFRRRVFPFYDICCFISDELIFYLYFSIIVKQWEGLFYRIPWLIPALPFLTLISLLALTIYLGKHNMGLSLMAYGILSIVFYSFFVTWMYTTKPSPAKKQFTLWTWNMRQLAGLLALAISIQTVFMPIIKRNADRSQNKRLLFFSLLIGASLYVYFGIVGGYGLIDRIPAYKGAQTVMQYFVANRWEPIVLEIIYLIHLYTVWPERVAINKKRLMGLIHVEENQLNTNAYVCLSAMVACVLYILNVKIQSFIQINGGICLFFIIYAVPIWLHIKCSYLYDTTWGIDEATIELPHYDRSEQNLDIQCIKTRQQGSKLSWYFEGIFLITMLLFGLALLVLTLDQYVISKLFR